MRSSPSHSGILSRTTTAGYTPPPIMMTGSSGGSNRNGGNTSTMEELQNAIQGAIAHCKNSMLIPNNNNKTMVVSHEI